MACRCNWGENFRWVKIFLVHRFHVRKRKRKERVWYIPIITITITRTTRPMKTLIRIFCHHIFLATLREVDLKSSALEDNMSDRSSRDSSLPPRSRILLIFSDMMFDTSFTCSFNFCIFLSSLGSARCMFPPLELEGRLEGRLELEGRLDPPLISERKMSVNWWDWLPKINYLLNLDTGSVVASNEYDCIKRVWLYQTSIIVSNECDWRPRKECKHKWGVETNQELLTSTSVLLILNCVD